MRPSKALALVTLASLVALGLAGWRYDSVAGQTADGPAETAKNSPAETSIEAPSAAVQLDPKLIQLRDRLRGVLRHYDQKKLNSTDNTAWEVMHMVIAHGIRAELHVGGPEGPVQNSIGWLCYNHAFKGDRLLTVENDRPLGIIGVGLQGHHGQLLAILAQASLQRDYPMRVAGHKFTVEDLIENEKLTCRSGMELTFKLIAFSHYLSTEAFWKNEIGQDWSISRLIREEMRAPIQGAACGGTHRLMGLSYAVRKRLKEGLPLDGEFARAHKYLQDYHAYTLHLQNPDGSFSTQWLEYREARPDLERRLQTTGHILEWLAYSLSEAELREPDAVRAAEYLTNLLDRGRQRNWAIGPLGHGLHALALYDQRAFRAERKTPAERHEIDLPPAREPRGVQHALNKDWSGERSVLIQYWALDHARRSVRPIPVPPPELSLPAASAGPGAAQPPQHVGQDSGPLLVPPRPVLK